jgi:hypothetical protein
MAMKNKKLTSDDKWRKKVRADTLHQIWWAETNQEEKEIERRKNIKLTPEQKKKHWKNYGEWRVEYLRNFLKKL